MMNHELVKLLNSLIHKPVLMPLEEALKVKIIRELLKESTCDY